MVSIHNTHEFHNYIISLPQPVIKTNTNTMLEYIESNYPDIFNIINSIHSIRHKLNNPSFKYTLFLPLNNFDYSTLLNNLYKGEFMVDGNDYLLVSESGTSINIKGNMVNDQEITMSNIIVNNGIINIL